MNFSIKDFFSKCDQIRSGKLKGKIWGKVKDFFKMFAQIRKKMWIGPEAATRGVP